MSLGGLMLVAGMAEAYNEDVARKKELAADILASQTKYLMETGLTNIQNMREKKKAGSARVNNAERNWGFSRKAAIALEASGQLEFELEKLKGIGVDKIAPNYIKDLTKHLESQIDNDEDLAAAVVRGLQGDSFATEEEQALGLINAMGDLTELQKEFMKTTQDSRTVAPKLNYQSSKGAAITLPERKSIQSQLATSLGTIFQSKFKTSERGDVVLFQFDDPEVQTMFNELTRKTIDLKESPTTSFSASSALNAVIGSVQNAGLVQPQDVLANLDNALANPQFDWTPFESNVRTSNNNNSSSALPPETTGSEDQETS